MENFTHEEIKFSDSAKFIIEQLCTDEVSADHAAQELLFLITQIRSQEGRDQFIADLKEYVKKATKNTEKAKIIINFLQDVLSNNASPELPVKKFEIPGKAGINRKAMSILHNPAMR
jgi:endonuclease III